MKLRSGLQTKLLDKAKTLRTRQASRKGLSNDEKFDLNAASLLLKLPQEIKNMIWAYVCGGNVIHIIPTGFYGNYRVSHYICSSPSQVLAQEPSLAKVPSTTLATLKERALQVNTGFELLSYTHVARSIMKLKPSSTQTTPSFSGLRLSRTSSCKCHERRRYVRLG